MVVILDEKFLWRTRPSEEEKINLYARGIVSVGVQLAVMSDSGMTKGGCKVLPLRHASCFYSKNIEKAGLHVK